MSGRECKRKMCVEMVHGNHGSLSPVLQLSRLTKKGKTVEGTTALPSIMGEAACRS